MIYGAALPSVADRSGRQWPKQTDRGRKTIYAANCALPHGSSKRNVLPSVLMPLAIIGLGFVKKRVDRAVNVLGLGSKRAVRAHTAVNRSIFEL